MATTPPEQPGIRLIVESPYEGGTKQWSNRWFFNGPNWHNEAEFEFVADELQAKYLAHWLSSTSRVVEAIGTNGGSDIPLYTKPYTAYGTWDDQYNYPTPLQCAALVKITTTARSVKNHPIYLFKYLHAVYYESKAHKDYTAPGQASGFVAEIQDWCDGITTPNETRKVCGPRGAVGQTASIDEFITHRDFLA